MYKKWSISQISSNSSKLRSWVRQLVANNPEFLIKFHVPRNILHILPVKTGVNDWVFVHEEEMTFRPSEGQRNHFI